MAMRLVCYPTSESPPEVVPASFERNWMDQTGEGFAYRCLPLNIANAHGWLILNPTPFVASWRGGVKLDAVTIRAAEGSFPIAMSHFGSGVLTFGINALFRTDPGYDLMVTGPFNQPKDAIQPLSGVVETDWAPFSFTMNWKFTRKDTPVAFERDEPFCMIFPLRRGLVEEVVPEFHTLDSDPRVSEAYRRWAESRSQFNKGLRQPNSPERTQKWQKDYFRGDARFGEAPRDHRTKLKVRDFVWSQL